jgi:hypothetical protein
MNGRMQHWYWRSTLLLTAISAWTSLGAEERSTQTVRSLELLKPRTDAVDPGAPLRDRLVVFYVGSPGCGNCSVRETVDAVRKLKRDLTELLGRWRVEKAREPSLGAEIFEVLISPGSTSGPPKLEILEDGVPSELEVTDVGLSGTARMTFVCKGVRRRSISSCRRDAVFGRTVYVDAAFPASGSPDVPQAGQSTMSRLAKQWGRFTAWRRYFD